MGLSFLGLAVSPFLSLAMASIFLGGLAVSLINIAAEVIIQKSVDKALLGRAYGVIVALARAAQPAGYALAGILLTVIDLRPAVRVPLSTMLGITGQPQADVGHGSRYCRLDFEGNALG